MAGIGEALAVAGSLQPAFKACFETYGCYRLTKNFGEDFQKAERHLRGQMARLKLLGDTRINDLLTAPEDGSQLASTVTWTLQEMRKNFNLCENLMKKYGEPETPRKRLQKTPVAGFAATASLSPSSSRSSEVLSPPGSPVEKKSKTLFSRRQRSTPSITSSSNTLSPSTIDTDATPKNSSPSSMSSLYDSKITQGLHEDAVKVKALQSSSSLLERLKWATEDRRRFFSAIEELTGANDLLENLLRIRSPEDETFLSRGQENEEDVMADSISAIRAALERLHQALLARNPNGREIEFSLKLTLDDREKEIYADYVDVPFQAGSSVHALQAHIKKEQEHSKMSYYFLAETAIEDETEVPVLTNLAAAVEQLDPDADPLFHCLGETSANEENHPKLRMYQDKTSCWKRTETLTEALSQQEFQDICFQKHYIQLGLFIAFSYAALPFTFKGKSEFPQSANYVYYDHVHEEAVESSVESITSDYSPSEMEEGNSTTRRSGAVDCDLSVLSIEERFQDLQSPYISFSFGSRPPKKSTKSLGKRPGFTVSTNNAVVSLGLLLYQIGSWHSMPSSNNIAQMRRDALDRSHNLIRLSGVEFADITRACLNWKEKSTEGTKSNAEDMLMKIYIRLDEYNKGLQDLL